MFIQNSTCHGFHYCFDQKHIVRRLFWIILVATSVGLLLQKLHESTVKYFNYPFSTTTTISYIDEMKFPAISICNLNDFRMSRMKGTKLHKLLQEKNKTKDDLVNKISGEEYATTIKGANHNLNDMLFSCSIYDKNIRQTNTCNSKNFSTFYQKQGEKCYTFNSGEFVDIIMVNETGTSKSFDLTLNVEHYDYYVDTIEAGIRLIIHDQKETPVRMTGITLSPGFTSYVQISKTKVNIKLERFIKLLIKFYLVISIILCWKLFNNNKKKHEIQKIRFGLQCVYRIL